MINGKTVLAEVGVGPLSMCFSALYWNRSDMHFMLFEPLPDYFKQVAEAAKHLKNVEIHNVAIGDENGTTKFNSLGTSSSIAGVASPLTQHYGKEGGESIEVAVRKISDYDYGQIDILRVDTEGAEWFCIKNMVSRPRQIVVEMYNDLGSYVNPYLIEIQDWAKSNGYKLQSVQDADFVYSL